MMEQNIEDVLPVFDIIKEENLDEKSNKDL